MFGGVLAIDVDADGDLVVTGPSDEDLYLNDGAAGFGPAPPGALPPVTAAYTVTALAFADLDGDGDQDLVMHGTGQSAHGIRLLDNDGSGRFVDVTSARFPAGLVSTSMRVVDLDGDGDSDIFLGGYRFAATCVNDGAGTFPLAGPDTLPFHAEGHPRWVADFDRDGDLDAVESVMQWGTRRQLHAPRLPRLGQRYEVDVHDRGAGQRLGLWWLGLDRLAVPLEIADLGVLHVDPARSLLAPGLLLQPGSTIARGALDLPVDPRLLGVRFHLQGLVVSATNALALTNTVRGTVVQ